VLGLDIADSVGNQPVLIQSATSGLESDDDRKSDEPLSAGPLPDFEPMVKSKSSPVIATKTDLLAFSVQMDESESSASDLDEAGPGHEIKSNLHGPLSDDDECLLKRRESAMHSVSPHHSPNPDPVLSLERIWNEHRGRRSRARHSRSKRRSTSRASSVSSSSSMSSSRSMSGSASSGRRSRRRSISSEYSSDSGRSSWSSSERSHSSENSPRGRIGSNLENMMNAMMEMMTSAQSAQHGANPANSFKNISGVLSPLSVSQGDHADGRITPLALEEGPPVLAPADPFSEFVMDRFGRTKPMDHVERFMKLEARIAAIQLVPSVSNEEEERCSEHGE